MLAWHGDIGAIMTALADRRRRLLFRAQHRGTKENDQMIGGFVAARVAELTAAEIDLLEVLLTEPEARLADWLTGRQPIQEDSEATAMLRAMRDFVQAGGAVRRP